MTETSTDTRTTPTASTTPTSRQAHVGNASPPPRVTADFDRAAKRYDLMVALNPGYHRHLRSAARALLDRVPDRLGPADPVRLLDLGCGSGASTRALLTEAHSGAENPNPDPRPRQRDRVAPASTARLHRDSPRNTASLDIVALDASVGMLTEAAEKDWPSGVRFVHGLAQELPRRRAAWGIAERLDGVFAAYLFRNVPVREPGGGGRDDVLRSVRDLLRPGGMLVTQEYSVSGSRAARAVWTIICRLIVMPLSRITRTDVELYDYLWHSVLRFDSVEQFTDRLWQAGFVDVEVRTVPGWQRGILHTFRATAP